MNNAHSHHPDQSQHRHNEQNAVEVKLTDPVCGMSVDPSTERKLKHAGETYGFCSDGCLGRFKTNPEKYLSPKDDDAPAFVGTEYTCPMHPEVVQIGPGTCRKCGMALESTPILFVG